MLIRRISTLSVLLLAALFITPTGQCQNVADGDSAAAAHVPAGFLAAVRLKLRKALRSPSLEMMPIEIAEAWSREVLGLDLMSVEEIKVVVAMPAGPGEPPIGVVVTTSNDYHPSKLSPQLLAEPQPRQIGDREVYVLGNGNDVVYLFAVDARTFVIATPATLEPMAAEAEGKGPLANLIRANPIGDADVQVVAAIEPARPMLVQAAPQFGERLPPAIQDLTRVPDLLDAVVANARLSNRGAGFAVEFLAADQDKAAELLEILTQSIDFGRQTAASQMEQEAQGDGPLAESQRAYARRFTSRMAEMITPKQDGNRLIIESEVDASIASTGVMVGLLLPAVQAAREAARRTQAANNLKQIGAALRAYHDKYERFPAPAIVDEDGKPLLSWRVAILPFLDQQNLYDEFHLDQPWDSPRNLKLASENPPQVFLHPGAVTPPGHTVFQAAVGEELAFPTQGIRIADITDGTSNTIMVVETDAGEAVPWAAPQDVQINLNDPIPQMGHNHPGGFQVLLADGTVIFITHSVEVKLLRALLTRGGGEQLDAVR